MAKKKSNKIDESKTYAFLATFLSIIGFIIVLLTRKNDKYAMFYAKQSLVVFLAFVVAWVVMIIPVIGWIIGWIVYIIAVILWVMSWIYALSGQEKEVPIVGKFARNFNL